MDYNVITLQGCSKVVTTYLYPYGYIASYVATQKVKIVAAVRQLKDS